MFSILIFYAVNTLSNNLGGNKLVEEGNDFYIVGADSVQKKLGDNDWELTFTLHNHFTVLCTPIVTGNKSITVTVTYKNGELTVKNNYISFAGSPSSVASSSILEAKDFSLTSL